MTNTNTSTKITKRDNYKTLTQILLGEIKLEKLPGDEIQRLVDFLEMETGHLIKKAMKERERAAKKRAEGDELKAKVAALIGNDWITPDAILEQIDTADATRNKVIARVALLVKEGVVEKEVHKIDERRVVVYRLTQEAEEVETTDAE